jgi:hypothetical protein
MQTHKFERKIIRIVCSIFVDLRLKIIFSFPLPIFYFLNVDFVAIHAARDSCENTIGCDTRVNMSGRRNSIAIYATKNSIVHIILPSIKECTRENARSGMFYIIFWDIELQFD